MNEHINSLLVKELKRIASEAGGWDAAPRYYPVVGFPDDMGQPDLFVQSIYRLGHYYSPLLSRSDASRSSMPVTERLGFNLNLDRQLRILSDFGKYGPGVKFQSNSQNDAKYYTNNGQYSGLDALVLWNMIARNRPARIIEIGSGFSTLLMSECIRSQNFKPRLECIEPYPREFLRNIPEVSNLVELQLQDVPTEFFRDLKPRDIVFLDSSHVSKTNSDVNFFVFNVLPLLSPGVLVHIHDIFIPDEYPPLWIQEGRNWNEQYLIRAFLIGNREYEIEFLTHYMYSRHSELIQAATDYHPEYGSGGSLWIVRSE